MPIALIAAVAKNNVIGQKNALPWHLPEDLKRFRKLTEGRIVLMGQKTFDSIIERNGKPLPNRVSVVLSRDPGYKAPEGVVVYNDLRRAVEDYKDRELFVIGGGEIFRQTLDLADTLYITHVDREVEGDVFFPEIDPKKWKKATEEKHDTFSFCTYVRM